MKEEIGDNDEILNIVNEKKILIKKYRHDDDSTKHLKKDYPEKFIKLEETSLNYMDENELKVLKEEFPGNRWKFSTEKLAYPYEYFNCLDDYETPVDNLKNEDSFSNLKI